MTGAGQIWSELDAAPQRLAGPFRVYPGRIAGLAITLGDQVGTLGSQRPLALAAGFVGRVKHGSFGLNISLRRPGSFRGHLVQTEQVAVRVAGQRLGVEDQRADHRVNGPFDVAEQFAGMSIAGPGPPGPGQVDGGGCSRRRSPIEVHLELHLVHKILTSVENFRRWRCCPQDRGVSPNGASPTGH